MVEMNLRYEDPDGDLKETCARGECVVAFVIKDTEKVGVKMRYEVAGYIHGEGKPEGILKAAAHALGNAATISIRRRPRRQEAYARIKQALLEGFIEGESV
ncbi:MAG: hypothetical protein ACSW8H_01625 [bacterium]